MLVQAGLRFHHWIQHWWNECRPLDLPWIPNGLDFANQEIRHFVHCSSPSITPCWFCITALIPTSSIWYVLFCYFLNILGAQGVLTLLFLGFRFLVLTTPTLDWGSWQGNGPTRRYQHCWRVSSILRSIFLFLFLFWLFIWWFVLGYVLNCIAFFFSMEIPWVLILQLH